MESAYPSSQSFFDSTSDSIRTEDVAKCRSSSSSNFLSDLFTRNSNCASDLFSNSRAPVFVPADVTFPAKKIREGRERVAERVSLWHEWGSGECATETVAQESTGFLSDLLKPSNSEVFKCTNSSLFPDLGSVNVAVAPEEFTFPARKNRGDSSWREERNSRLDWSSGVIDVDASVEKSTTVINTVTDFFSKNQSKSSDMFSISKSSVFSSLGSSVSGTESSFPARKKRTEERSFWHDYSCGDIAPTLSPKLPAPSTSGTGVSALADLYTRKQVGKCSGLFSNMGAADFQSPEDVVFPARKNREDRNSWRDWSNTGYTDWAEYDTEEETAEASDVCRVSAGTLVDGAVTTCPVDSSLYTPILASGLASRRVADVQSKDLDIHDTPCKECGLVCDVCAEEETRVTSSTVRAVSDSSAPNVDAVSSRPNGSVVPNGRAIVSGDFVEAGDIQVQTGQSKFKSDSSVNKNSKLRGTDFPPPLGSLGTLASPRTPRQTPWVQLQPIRSDGRFVLQEVEVSQPVLFQPIRKHGRLVLQLRRQSIRGPDQRLEESVHVGIASSNSTTLEQTKAEKSGLVVDEVVQTLEASPQAPSVLVVDSVIGKARRKKSMKGPKVWPMGSLSAELEALDKGVEVAEIEKADESLNSTKSWESGWSTVNRGGWDDVSGNMDGPGEVCRQGPPMNVNRDVVVGRKLDLHPWTEPSVKRVEDSLRNSEIARSTEREKVLQAHVNYKSDAQAPYNNNYWGCNAGRFLGPETGLSGPTLHRCRSIRNTSLSEIGRVEVLKEETVKDSSLRVLVEEAFDLKPPYVSGLQTMEGGMNLKAPVHPFYHWNLKKRSECPNDPDPRLPSYSSVAAAFSCADGVGKPHEKRFWEQPCVS